MGAGGTSFTNALLFVVIGLLIANLAVPAFRAEPEAPPRMPHFSAQLPLYELPS